MALVLWGSAAACYGSLKEQLGALTAAAWMFGGGGILLLLVAILRGEGRRLLALDRRYLVAGSVFVALYTATLYWAIGMAISRQQVLEITLIHYLWPALTLVLSIPILGRKARPLLLVGIAVALTGIVFATTPGHFNWDECRHNFAANKIPYILAVIAAFSWAIFSNTSRLWGGTSGGAGMSVFFIFTGLVMGCLRLFHHEPTIWAARTVWELIYAIIFPTAVAGLLWETAMRRGHMIMVVSFSYMVPLLSTVIYCWYMRLPLGRNMLLAGVLIIVGSVLCDKSVVEPAEAPKPRT